MQKKRSRASNKLGESEWKRIKTMLNAAAGHPHALDSLATHKMGRIVFSGENVVRMAEELQNAG